MTKEKIALAAGYEIYANLASDFRKSCDTEDDPVNFKDGSLYARLYADGAK